MSRAWIAFYVGDYLRDTAHLTTEQHGAYFLLLTHCWQHGSIPLGDGPRAAITRLPLSRWKKLKEVIEPFFQPDGTQKRATEEIAKAEAVSLKRAMAGRNGGLKSGVSKAIASGHRSKQEANALARLKQMTEQTPKQNGSISEANHITPIITNSLDAVEHFQSAGSLASALVDGALTRQPSDGASGTRPHETSRADLDAMIAKRRGDPPVEPKVATDEGGIPPFLKRQAG